MAEKATSRRRTKRKTRQRNGDRRAEAIVSNDILSVDQAASLLGIARSTLYKIVKRREIPFAKVGGAVRFSRRLLLRWVEQQSIRNLDGSADVRGALTMHEPEPTPSEVVEAKLRADFWNTWGQRAQAICHEFPAGEEGWNQAIAEARRRFEEEELPGAIEREMGRSQRTGVSAGQGLACGSEG